MTGLGKAGVRLLAVLTALTVLSQFFRVSNGVIAPGLIRDLGLTPSSPGLANGAFFLALLVMQITVGMRFDRIGPRRRSDERRVGKGGVSPGSSRWSPYP